MVALKQIRKLCYLFMSIISSLPYLGCMEDGEREREDCAIQGSAHLLIIDKKYMYTCWYNFSPSLRHTHTHIQYTRALKLSPLFCLFLSLSLSLSVSPSLFDLRTRLKLIQPLDCFKIAADVLFKLFQTSNLYES